MLVWYEGRSGADTRTAHTAAAWLRPCLNNVLVFTLVSSSVLRGACRVWGAALGGAFGFKGVANVLPLGS